MQKSMRLLCASLGLGLVLAVFLSVQWQAQAAFADTCAEIRADTLRLHVVANSNSVADQIVKLQVRDAVLAEMKCLYQENAIENRDESVALAMANTPRLALAASKALASVGVQQMVTVYLTEMQFSTTEYDDFTLPAGDYTALRVELGTAEGNNWWCVLYPSLCIASASTQEQYDADDENEVIVGDYALRFAALEWWQKLQEKV